MKTALAKNLMIPTGDDPENTSKAEKHIDSPTQKAAKAAQEKFKLTPPQEKKTEEPPPPEGDNVFIGEAKRQALWRAARKAKHADQETADWIGVCGYNTSAEIPLDKYDAMLKRAMDQTPFKEDVPE